MYLIGSTEIYNWINSKKLENENKVNINDSVTKYLPWFETTKR